MNQNPNSRRVELWPLRPFPKIRPGDDLASLIASALANMSLTLCPGDILVVAQKVISKSEGRIVRLDTVRPSERAVELAARTGKDPRLVELILQESTEVVRVGVQVIVVEHRLGFVVANAGIDQSNVSDDGGEEEALLLPEDPDRSARSLRDELSALTNVTCGLIINDSWGRAWRRGVVGQAIGVAGLQSVVDLRGRRDMNGRELKATDVAQADELAAAGSLLMGQADEGTPIVLIRGFAVSGADGDSRALLRPRSEDLFR
jgi:coenzyme F420-0:L-glutamate ligase/coenzyme F420-1:gamma-L-glutamate ligase